MSVFYCHYCGQLKDGDFDGCCEVPGHPYENACEQCDVEHNSSGNRVTINGETFDQWRERMESSTEEEV